LIDPAILIAASLDELSAFELSECYVDDVQA
jgi:hypothetical protein